MKNFWVLLILAAGLVAAGYRFLPAHEPQHLSPEISQLKVSAANTGESELSLAYKQRAQDIQVQGEGEVIKMLADDNQGSKHQRFIVRAPEGFTVLVAHNIDLAPRVEKLAVGDKISFFGEYVWNEKGGVMHWTHHDPRGRHVGGWLKHHGATYQ